MNPSLPSLLFFELETLNLQFGALDHFTVLFGGSRELLLVELGALRRRLVQPLIEVAVRDAEAQVEFNGHLSRWAVVGVADE
jgi:hypothetical protein